MRPDNQFDNDPTMGTERRTGRRRPPGRGGPHRGRRGGRGGRARRGDIRAGILALLAEEPQHGYQLMRQMDERSAGAWRPSPGSVYPTLAQLEDEQLVTSADLDGRRVFTITDAGRAEAEGREGPSPWDEVAQGRDTLDARPLVMAVRQVVASGDTAQIEAARKVIAKARRELYLILAGERPGE